MIKRYTPDIPYSAEIRARLALNEQRLNDACYQMPEVFSPADYAWPGDKEGRALLAFVSHYKATGHINPCMPEMMKALKEVEAMEGMHDKYYETMAHSYKTSDPAFSVAAGSISTYFGVKEYPRLTYNFVYDIQSDRNASHIAQQINTLWKESADAGIAASASLATTSVVVNAEVKAAVANEYRITAWLLEDGIEGAQLNATEDWMNIHNNAIRQAATLNPISGFDLGNIEAGKCATQAMNLAITGASSNKWNRDNLKVMVIASAKNGAGKFEVVNVVICPVNGSVIYDYKK